MSTVEVLVFTADPCTGEPALVGEVVGTDGPAPGTPLDDLRDGAPDLHRGCVAALAGETDAVRVRLGCAQDGIGLVERTLLPLTPGAALRFHLRQLERGVIDADTLLRRLPVAALEGRRLRLVAEDNTHLVPVAAGTAVSGDPVVGRLARDVLGPPGPTPTGGLPRVVLVDRVDAHHTGLIDDPGCAGVLALRGSPVDHFALLARDRGFGYLVLAQGARTAAGWWTGSEVIPDGSVLTVDFATATVYRGHGTVTVEPGDRRRDTVRGLLALGDRDRRSAGHPARAPHVAVDTADDLPGGLPADVPGIGLVRTEHLMRRHALDADVRAVVTGGAERLRPDTVDVLARELARLLRAADGRPVSVRLLDYPLHELGGVPREVNPMLGRRGVRQGVCWPALYRGQIEAVVRATQDVGAAGGSPMTPEILVPMVADPAEVGVVAGWVDDAVARSGADGLRFDVGAMVETPAAAMAAGELARRCTTLAFGAADLTQLVLGLSRDDHLAVLAGYRRRGLVEDSPFDRTPDVVRDLVRSAARRARRVRPDITLAWCGTRPDDRVLDLVSDGLLDRVVVPLDIWAPVALRAWQRSRR